MSHYIWKEIYTGEEKIVVAMDIGTTHSAVSFAHLLQNQEPVVHMVTDWPGQSGISKIPTIAAYHGKKGRKWGLEVVDLGKKGYPIAKWFKLHLHPPSMTTSAPVGCTRFEMPDLPNGVDIEQVYVDFMRYLIKFTQSFFGKRLPNGAEIWRRRRSSILIILTIPNGWGPAEQHVLRNAAVRANLVVEAMKHDNLEFVTEGEASVHWALAYNQARPGSRKIYFDAGSSTVDSTLYKCVATEPKLILHEACASECVQAGGIFVDRAARALLEAKLGSSKFAQNKNLDRMEGYFKEDIKRSFDGTQHSMRITVGGAYENDQQLSIKEGQVFLQQKEICRIFEDVVERIKRSCHKLMGDRNVKHLLLVGGFGESLYLQKMLDEEFKTMGVSIVTIGDASKKAPAEGALMWFLKKTVTTRIAKFTLGMECTPDYDHTNSEHRKRRAHLLPSANGTKLVPHEFCMLIQKGEVIDTGFTREQEFHVHCASTMENECSFELFVWEGEGTPKWFKDPRGNFISGMRSWGHLEINWANIRTFLALQLSRGHEFYEINFKVVIKPKGTQLQAVIRAQYEDTICEGPVTFVPNAISSDAVE